VRRKSGIEIIPAAFTDHHAVALRVTIQDQILPRRSRRWKMDPTMMQDDVLKRKLRDNWMQWRSRKRHYPDVAMWWERCAKNNLQRLVRAEERERHRNFHHMENHLHECLYDIIRSDMPEKDKFLELQRYKTKLMQLHATQREKLQLDTSVQDRMEGEEPSLFHLLKTLRLRNTRATQRVQDSHCNLETCPQELANIFLTYLRHKIEPVAIDRDSLHSLQAHIQPMDPASAERLEQPVTLEEVITASRSCAKHKNSRLRWHLRLQSHRRPFLKDFMDF
jgi:hypothetical protein